MNNQRARNILIWIIFPIISACFIIFFCEAVPTVHAASTNGSVSGTLLNGTDNNAPVVGQSVTLQVAQGGNGKDLASIKTDQHGAFSFSNLTTDKTASYALYTSYQGAQYVRELFTLSSSPHVSQNLTVYDATQSSADIAVVQSTILIHPDSSTADTLDVSAVYAFENLTKKAYVGSSDTSHGKMNALSFWLPTGGTGISVTKGFDGYQVFPATGGFATNAAILPGSNEFSFSFTIPYNAAKYMYNYKALYPTVSVSFLVSTDVDATAVAPVKSLGVVDSGNDVYQSYSATQLLANQTVDLQLDNLPGMTQQQDTAPVVTQNTNTLWLLVAVAIMVVVLAVTWLLYRRLRRRPVQRKHKRKDVPKQEKNVASVKEKREGLLQEMLQLDKEFEDGKIEKAVYDERRSKLKARLRTVMTDREMARK